MSTALGVLADILLALFLLALVALAGVGLWLISSRPETARQRLARQSREAEAKITEIGRRAQAAIVAEALHRNARRAERTHDARPDNGGYRPWDD
jgi:hypothetical protein